MSAFWFWTTGSSLLTGPEGLSAKERENLKKLKALRRYRRRYGAEALLHRQLRERRQTLTEGAPQVLAESPPTSHIQKSTSVARLLASGWIRIRTTFIHFRCGQLICAFGIGKDFFDWQPFCHFQRSGLSRLLAPLFLFVCFLKPFFFFKAFKKWSSLAR